MARSSSTRTSSGVRISSRPSIRMCWAYQFMSFGHVAGWTVHFSGGTDCPTYYFDSPYYQTMCGSASTLKTHFMRTLEDHDEHVQAGGY